MSRHVASCSFGKDSVATVLLAIEHGEPLDEVAYCEVMFDDAISGEIPEHIDFIREKAIPAFERYGIKTAVLRSDWTYVKHFTATIARGQRKGKIRGFPLCGICTICRDCKLPPIREYVNALPEDTVQYIGIAKDEQERLLRLDGKRVSLLNKYGIGYLIVTKSDLICEYMNILDKELAHIQISTTWIPCEKAVSTERRIAAIERLHAAGFDTAVRLSPFVPQFVDFDRLNSIQCPKIIVEFLRVNHWIRSWLPLDYSEYTVKHAGYLHLPLEKKVQALSKITGFDEVSVCEDVTEHFEYWRECVNHSKEDCCNLRKA